MTRVSFGIATVLTLSALPLAEARAAAFCAYAGGGRGGAYENCGYFTWEQCRAAVSGVGGFCMRNPHDPSAWGAPAAPQGYKHRRHRAF